MIIFIPVGDLHFDSHVYRSSSTKPTCCPILEYSSAWFKRIAAYCFSGVGTMFTNHLEAKVGLSILEIWISVRHSMTRQTWILLWITLLWYITVVQHGRRKDVYEKCSHWIVGNPIEQKDHYILKAQGYCSKTAIEYNEKLATRMNDHGRPRSAFLERYRGKGLES